MSTYLDRLKLLSKNTKLVHSNVSFIRAIEYIETLETILDQLPKIEVDPMSNEGPKTYELDEVFEYDNTEWITTAQTDGFIIATRTDIVGEPESHLDIVRITKP